MKYKLFEKSLNDTNRIIETVLLNRGIKNPNEYLNLTAAHCNEYNMINNINDAVECFEKHFERGDAVSILVDTDP